MSLIWWRWGAPFHALLSHWNAQDLTGLPDARLDLDGLVAGNPARGGLRLRERAAGGYGLEDLDISIGSARLAGAVDLDSESRAQGRISLAAQDLDDLSALALTELSGALDATIDLAVRDGGQDARVAAQGSRLGFGDMSLSAFEADMRGAATCCARRLSRARSRLTGSRWPGRNLRGLPSMQRVSPIAPASPPKPAHRVSISRHAGKSHRARRIFC